MPLLSVLRKALRVEAVGAARFWRRSQAFKAALLDPQEDGTRVDFF